MKFKILTLFALLLIAILFYIKNSGSNEDIVFKNGETTLSGTLYLPRGDGPFPAVVFVHGSGAETRENSQYSAKWFASIGYAALTYDKRGTGQSNGEENEWKRFNFDALAGDVISAVNFLSKNEIIDKSKIGLHATSQGGWIAPLAASKSDLIHFLIIKSGSVTNVSEDRIFERSARLRKEGFSDIEINEALKMQMVEGKTISGKSAKDEFTSLFEINKNKAWFARVYPGKTPFSESLVNYRTWYATIVDFDPIPFLKKIDKPIMWIFGDSELDQSGPVKKSIINLTRLKNQGKAYEILQLQGEGHNVTEEKYEREVYEWLKNIYAKNPYKFKKHSIF